MLRKKNEGEVERKTFGDRVTTGGRERKKGKKKSLGQVGGGDKREWRGRKEREREGESRQEGAKQSSRNIHLGESIV